MLDLIKYDPLKSYWPEWNLTDWFFGPSLFRRLEEEDRFFAPRVDIAEKEKEYELKAEVPGYAPDEVKVEVEKGRLMLKAEHKEEKEEEKEHYHLRERRYGSLVRTFTLPEDADADKIEATAKDGVLTVTIPKTEAAKPKKIEVKRQ